MLTDSIDGVLAGPTDSTGLVLERIPSGDLAWLRPESDGSEPDGSDARRIVVTQRGRDLLARWRAEFALFGREVSAS